MKANQYSIEIVDEAGFDFDRSYEYYFEDSPKVADTFFRKINLSLNEIRQSPFAFPIVYNDVRKYVVRKFPFVIYYQLEDSIIKVIAIFHSSRSPEIWNERV